MGDGETAWEVQPVQRPPQRVRGKLIEGHLARRRHRGGEFG